MIAEASTTEPLDELSAFVAVVAARSFTAAATRLGSTKSRLSKQVTRLEDRLGVRLLHRTTRRLSLTEAGEVLYERAARALADITEAQQEIAGFQQEPQGRLRVSAPMSYGLSHVVQRIPAFMRRYPKIVVDLQMDDRKVDIVSDAFDVVIRIGRLEDSSLVARHVAPVHMYTVASPGYLAKHGVPQHPLDLRTHACLVYTGTAPEWHYTGDDGREYRVDVNGVLFSNNGQALREAALAGIGIMRPPDFAVARDIAEGRLVPLLTGFRTPDPDVYLVLPERKHMAPKVRAFVEFMGEALRRQP